MAFNENFAFVTGAQYTSRGFGMRENFNVDIFGIDLPLGARIETRLDYIEVPATLKYTFGDHGVTPYVKAGASAAYAINGKIQPKVDAIITWKLLLSYQPGQRHVQQAGYIRCSRCGMNLPVSESGAIQFEVNYRHSLMIVLDNITDIKIKSHGFSAGLGYTMRF